ncbi:serine/threonine-protein kinase Nek8 [Glossina fuscipes]|uniref:non-specific serine/threonine protein kinase n=1 Tax=Glossina fuscipes TaxID=7396 RepID=A0A9C6DV77_9MUSC|nr:serine/threonine-protein kinase Nek8 [Glossina fuscipes]
MKKLKAKASTLSIFNGRISDSSTSSNDASSIVLSVKEKRRATFNGFSKSTIFSIYNQSANLTQIEKSTLELMNEDIAISEDTINSQDYGESSNAVGAELSDYDKIKIVGQGSFGIAVLYKCKTDQRHVVFKQINLNNLSEAEQDLAMNEVEVFSKLHHPNIISYFGSFVKDNTLLIEMEYADGGTLAQGLAARKIPDYFPERYIIAVFEQISSAINYMHDENILHRDLKTANVFLNSRGIVKIGDFGISKIMTTKIHAQTVLGTPYYFSPEMCEGKEYDHKSDIWALGCILGELCCLRKTFAASNLSELVSKIMAGSYTPIPMGYTSALRSLLSNLLQVDPAHRPKASEILEYWIPLIFRSLGKNKGYSYEDDSESIKNSLSIISSGTLSLHNNTSPDRSSRQSTTANLATAQTVTKEVMNAQTVAPSETIEKRSVLYQVKTFGKSFDMNPIQLPPKAYILTVATSNTHFVVVNSDGSVYTWGEGSHGQLGLSSLEAWKHYPSRMDSIRNHHIISACAGEGFTILLTQTGGILSCGDNSKYALGHNDNKIYHSPKFIEKLEDIKIKDIKAGLTHVLALSVEGFVYIWGTSSHGSLGLGELQTQQKTPQKILLSQAKNKVKKIFCGPDTSAILFENCDIYVCGSNQFNKLGFEKPAKITAMKKMKLPLPRRCIMDASFSTAHTLLLVEGGYILTLGSNSFGQRGTGHCSPLPIVTLVESMKDRYITNCKCSEQCSLVCSDDNVITFWGTRYGVPEISEVDISKSPMWSGPHRMNVESENNTSAFTNFLASVYKSELILEPQDILALYSSAEQMERGYYVTVKDIWPLPHSVLVLVETTAPLIPSIQDLGL